MIRFVRRKFIGMIYRAHDLWWERRLHIATSGTARVSAHDAVAYATQPFASMFRTLDRLELQPDDVFVDLGSGKGRVVACAAQYRVREVIGIEIEPDLYQMARQNVASCGERCRSPIRLVNGPAQAFDYDPITVLTLFNPFGAETLAEVLKAIAASINRRPRPVRMAYIHPYYEHVIREAGWLEEYERWKPRPSLGVRFDVSFLRWQPHQPLPPVQLDPPACFGVSRGAHA